MFETNQDIKRVAIYCRVSTDEQVQHGSGLEVQKEALINYIKIHNDKYSFDDSLIFTDEGKSGASKEEKDRPALFQMFQSAQRGEFDVLLVWKIDRFFRKTLYLLEGVDALDKLGIGFISITQNFDTTHAFGKMTLQMMGVIAELERELIKERTHSGVIATMKKGKWGRGCIPFGYDKTKDGFLIINKKEAEIVKLMYHLLVEEGSSLNAILKVLNDRSIETSAYKGKIGEKRQEMLKHKNHWHRTSVQRIVTNDIYTGSLIQNRYTQTRKDTTRTIKPESEWIISKCPQIISTEVFERARVQLDKNKTFSKRNTKQEHDYMLSTLLQDKATGYKYTGYTSSKGTKNYRIGMRNKSKDYVAPKGISGNKIEPVVWEKIVSVLKKPKMIIQELQKIEQLNNSRNIEQEIEDIESNISKVHEHSKQLLSLLSSGNMPVDDIKNMIEDNQNTIENLTGEIKELKGLKISEEEKEKKLQDLNELSQKMMPILEKEISYKGKMQICRLLIDVIKIDGKNIEIDLIIPGGTESKQTNRKEARLDLVKDFFDEGSSFIDKNKTFEDNILKGSTLCYMNGESPNSSPKNILLMNSFKREKLGKAKHK